MLSPQCPRWLPVTTSHGCGATGTSENRGDSLAGGQPQEGMDTAATSLQSSRKSRTAVRRPERKEDPPACLVSLCVGVQREQPLDN